MTKNTPKINKKTSAQGRCFKNIKNIYRTIFLPTEVLGDCLKLSEALVYDMKC